MRLQGKVAIITAGQIGEAYATASRASGDVAAAIEPRRGRAVAAARAPHAQPVDASERSDAAGRPGRRQTASAASRVINNAAIFCASTTDQSFAYLKKIFDVNPRHWLMSRASFRTCAGGGCRDQPVVVGGQGRPEMPMADPTKDPLPSFHYSLTKAAINAMTHFMAGNVGRFGIRVNAIAPGPTMTDATKTGVPQEILQLIIQFQMAIHRPLEPEYLTGTAVWLASDDAAMVTGQVIPVDGGMIMLG
jgi:NAD(P)-dependent dehydrogenase (short-subunit alcohol dehydrogenase family)